MQASHMLKSCGFSPYCIPSSIPCQVEKGIVLHGSHYRIFPFQSFNLMNKEEVYLGVIFNLIRKRLYFKRSFVLINYVNTS